MIKNARNKMMSARDQFIIQKAKQGFTPEQIRVLLPGEGFRHLTRPRIHQIVESSKK